MFSGFDFGGSSISQGGRGISQVLYKTKFLHFSISLLDICRQYSVSMLVSDSRKPKRKSHIHQLQTDYNEWWVLTMSSFDLATKPDQIGPISCGTVFMSSSGRPRKTHLILFCNQTVLLFLEEMIQEKGDWSYFCVITYIREGGYLLKKEKCGVICPS